MAKRTSFAKIGVIILAVVAGLSLMGVGVSYWSETLNITGTVNMGDWGVQVTKRTCSHPAIISCDVVDSDTLGVTVTDAAAIGPDYYCEFEIYNGGTIPVKIQSIDVDPSPPASGVVVGVTDMLGMSLIGTQIDSAQTKDGKVHVSLTEDASQFTFTVTFEVVQWNQYVPPS